MDLLQDRVRIDYRSVGLYDPRLIIRDPCDDVGEGCACDCSHEQGGHILDQRAVFDEVAMPSTHHTDGMPLGIKHHGECGIVGVFVNAQVDHVLDDQRQW